MQNIWHNLIFCLHDNSKDLLDQNVVCKNSIRNGHFHHNFYHNHLVFCVKCVIGACFSPQTSQ